MAEDGDAGRGDRQEQQQGGAPGSSSAPQASGTASADGKPAAEAKSAAEAKPAAGTRPAAGGGSPAGTRDNGQQTGGRGEKKGAGADGREGTESAGTPVASKEESAAKNRPGAVDAQVAGKQLNPADKRGQGQPAGTPSTARPEAQQPGAVSTLDGVRTQDLEGPQEKVDEDPFGAGSESEVDVGGGEPSAWDVTLHPDDYLPAQDLDVAAVPTADKLDPSASAAPATPSFPAPPVTKADTVQAERDAEDAEDAAEAEPEEEVDEPSAGAGSSADADRPDGAGPGGEALAPERAAGARTSPGAASKDPQQGADPKAGPVAAQVSVEQAPGGPEGGGRAKEQATKEEQGTPAAGDRSGAGQEKGSPQAAGAKSAEGGAASAPSAGGGERARAEATGKPEASPSGASAPSAGASGAAPAGANEPSGGAQSSAPARDSHVSGGSNADTSGGASADAAAGAQREPAGGGGPEPRTERPAQQGASEGGKGTPDGAKGGAEPAAAPAQPQTAAAPTPKAEVPQAEKAPPAAAARPAPAPKGAGGGGGAAVPVKKATKDSGPTPNLSNVSPEAGLATASKLKPHKAFEAMGGVGGAVDRTVGDEHKALAAAPPSMQRPAGAPETLQGKPKADAPAQYDQSPAQQSQAPAADKAEVTGAKEPEGQIEAEKAEEPGGWQTFKMALGFGIGWVAEKLGFKVDKQELAAKFAGLPTKDEALKKAQAGNAPGVQMQGAAGAKADEQGGAVDTKGQTTVATGRDDAGRPMGENQVYPNAPKERMAAKVPGPQGGGGATQPGGANTGAVPPEAASEVAEHDRGAQFQAAFGDGQKSMSKGRQKKDQDFRDSQERHKKQVDAEIQGNTKSQADERQKAMSEVTDHRSDWRKEQDQELKKLGDKKSDRHDKVRKDVKDKEEKTDKDSTKEKDDGDKKIQDKNTQAENDANKKRDDSVNESGNWLTKAFDWIKQKVIEIKNAIVDIIKRAREAVVGFIRHFKETVERWINEARQFIADAIKTLINDLIEFAKAMVRAVIELALRIRKLITDLISAAIALVNKLATMLKKALSDLLDAIGKLLSGILNILKQVLEEAVKQVKAAIKAVLDFASKLLSALGEWMLIAVDFLSDPGGWLSGAKNSAVDGAKNHLFAEISTAVKQWFKEKIQEILGVPKAILEKLLNGGFKLDDIVQETWNAVLPQLPLIIGELVMTKVVAKLIPGAGWVMGVIDAIRTAWGALSAILRALSMVLAWLKAVRTGGAGILFAKAVASGVVALLEVLYQWLLNGIGKYVAKVGQRLKGVAARLGKGVFGRGGRDRPRGAAGEGSGGRTPRSEEPSREPAPKSPGAPATRPRATEPREPKPGERPNTTRPGDRPGTTEPTHKPGETPDKPTPDRPTPDRPKSPTEDPKKPAKPTANDKNGKPKNPDEKPDTRPTPPAKPKPKPEPEPKPKPKEDSPTRPKDNEKPTSKPKEDDKPGPKPKEDEKPGRTPKEDDKPGTKPKEEPHSPNKPKEDPTSQPKPKDKPGEHPPTKPKPKPDKEPNHPHKPNEKHPDHDPKKPNHHPDKEHDPHAPKKPKPHEGEGKPPKHHPDEKGPHKPHHDKPNDKKPGKDKDAKKDKKKEDEKKKDSKEARLHKIVTRIRPQLDRLLGSGIRRLTMQGVLTGMRAWHRLTELGIHNKSPFEIVARLNPQEIVINGVTVDSLVVMEDLEKMAMRSMQAQRTSPPHLPAATITGATGNPAHFLANLSDGPDQLKNDITSYNFPEGSTVTSRQASGYQSNRFFFEGTQSAGRAEKYPQMFNFIEQHPSVSQQDFAHAVEAGIYGDPGRMRNLPPDARSKSRLLSSLLSGLEAYRSHPSLALNLMAVQLAAQGKAPLTKLLSKLPMIQGEAQHRGREVAYMTRMWQIIGDSQYRRQSFDPTTMKPEEVFRALDIPGRILPKRGFRPYPSFLRNIPDQDLRNRLAMMHALSEGLGIEKKHVEQILSSQVLNGARTRNHMLENLGHHIAANGNLQLNDFHFSSNTMKNYVERAQTILNEYLADQTMVKNKENGRRFYAAYLQRIQRLLFGMRRLP
ncbi:hypothetical protein ACFVFQ_30570 [Streptomyces sp. NPDC057743]|uniref:hypothetical protein n=1 Tax=Streptomyces sp. NPDC057743 TaxID=3346236 RepID=UPI00369801A6